MSDHDEKTTALGCGLMLALLLVIYLVQLALYQEVHTGTFRCVKTYTITTGGGDSISTSKRVDLKPLSGGATETMRCDDALPLLRWDSATTYAQFEVGKTYKITARGPRNPTFSMFPNVTQAVEIAE